ncbi:MAG: HPr family phosphocarrier protein [Clostridiales bacterium]|nr:HPr family phosphocarrier protein [Clostridiales bacterium]
MTMKIRLDSIYKVKEFVRFADRYDGKVEVSSGRCMVNGKSILDILSLDLSGDLFVKIEEKEDSYCFVKELQTWGLCMEEMQG